MGMGFEEAGVGGDEGGAAAGVGEADGMGESATVGGGLSGERGWE
jgi:hypothetical protein